MEECMELKTAIYDMVSHEKIKYIMGAHAVLAWDLVEPDVPIMENTLIFQELYLKIYHRFFQDGILSPIEEKENTPFALGPKKFWNLSL